jgi:hypothetical protein
LKLHEREQSMTSRRTATAGSATRNAKVYPDPASNTADSASSTVKDPGDWVSGDAPMTGAQAAYLKTLSEQALEPDAFSTKLTKAEASRRIEALKAKLKLQDGPPHTL